jgi:hypothetical protein
MVEGQSRSYAATEPSHGRIQPVREGEPSGQTPPLRACRGTIRTNPTLEKLGQLKCRRCVTGQSSDYVATDPRKEGVEGWKGL